MNSSDRLCRSKKKKGGNDLSQSVCDDFMSNVQNNSKERVEKQCLDSNSK